eukprot:808696_1
MSTMFKQTKSFQSSQRHPNHSIASQSLNPSRIVSFPSSKPLAMNINIRSRSRIVPRMAAAPPIQRRMTTGLPMAAALPSAEAAAPPRQRRMATLLPMAAALPSAEAAAPPRQRRMATLLPMAAALPSAEVAQRRMIWKDVAELENVPKKIVTMTATKDKNLFILMWIGTIIWLQAILLQQIVFYH